MAVRREETNGMTDIIDLAVAYRQVAHDLAKYIGAQPCTCVPTPEYAEYLRQEQEDTAGLSPAERMLYWINAPKFDGVDYPENCPRCAILAQYENAIGEDAVSYEIAQAARGVL